MHPFNYRFFVHIGKFSGFFQVKAATIKQPKKYNSTGAQPRTKTNNTHLSRKTPINTPDFDKANNYNNCSAKSICVSHVCLAPQCYVFLSESFPSMKTNLQSKQL